MLPLPDWMQRGAIVGMQGGTEAARAMAERLSAAGTPVAAFWLQDWVGARKTSVGSQLWWNWELDPVRYPDWDGLREEFAADGIRLMSYVNPFLVDVSEREQDCGRNLFQEARERGPRPPRGRLAVPRPEHVVFRRHGGPDPSGMPRLAQGRAPGPGPGRRGLGLDGRLRRGRCRSTPCCTMGPMRPSTTTPTRRSGPG